MNKKHFILFIILTLLASGVLLFGKDRFNNTTDDIIIPKEFIFQGKTIALAWTDDNTGEDLIIQSDRKEYSGFNEVDVYFSITNTNKEDQEMDVVVWVGNEKVEVKSIERLNEDNEAAGSIDAGTGLQPVSKYFPSERIDDISKHQERVANPFPQEEAEQSQAGSTASFRSRSTSDNGANDTRKDIKGFTSGYAVNDQIKSGETNFYRTKIKYPPMSDGEFFIEAFGVLRRLDGDLREKESAKTNKPLSRQSGKRDDEIAYGHLDPWYSSSWSYRRQIIIDHSEVADVADPSATYAGFSVYVHATGLSNIKADGADVRFTDSAGTELPREIEKYASGTLDAWVKFTLTKDAGDTSDDVIYMYYGNTDATEPAEDATYGREKVWDDNFVMVQHLSEDPGPGGAGEIVDSTQYDNDGTAEASMETEDQVAGQIDGSLDFITDDYIDIGDIGGNSNFTISAWLYTRNIVNEKTVIMTDNGWIEIYNGGFYPWVWDNRDGTGDGHKNTAAGVISINTWTFATLRVEGDSRLFYIDGQYSANVDDVKSAGANQDDRIGSGSGGVRYFDGLIDEVRISNIARTAGWIETEYNNQKTSSTFLTINAEEDNTPTEFISKIRASGGDYTLLSAWENEVECDLTATTTRVFSGALTLGALSENDPVELYRSGVDQGIDAYVVATATGGQILVDGITGVSYELVAQTGDVWRKDASNYWTISGTTGNELGDTAIAVAECYNDWPTGLEDNVTIDGWVTSATNYVKIYAPEGERHNGTAKDGEGNYMGFAIRPEVSATTIYNIEDHTIIDGIIVGLKSGWGARGIESHAPNPGAKITNCIVHGPANTSAFGILSYMAKVSNCIVYDIEGYSFSFTYSGTTHWSYNNTAINCGYGFRSHSSTATLYLKNCLAKGNTNGDFIHPGGEAYMQITNSASSDGTADDWGGTGNRVNQTFTFVDEANDDFHLAGADAGARNQGTDLSADVDYPFSTDIDGDTRPYGGVWDIGADEASGYAGVQPNSPYTNNNDWYDANWEYKRAITLESDQIETTESEFPVLVSTTLADLRTTANGGHVGNGNGYDIIFVDDDNSTLLNFEQEKYVPSTGEIVYWVNTDISSTTDKVIYMYYGNAFATDLSNAEEVWDDNFVMIQHLQEDPGPGGAGEIVDSTKYNNDGTAEASMTTEDQVAGQIDGSLDFDGGDDYVDCGGAASIAIHYPITVSLWVKPTESAERGLFGSGAGVQPKLLIRQDNTTNYIKIYTYDKYEYSTSPISIGSWNHITITRISGGAGNIYLDGDDVGDITAGNTGYNSQVYIGKDGYISESYGLIDEVRISNVARSVGWIETEYNNQSDVGSFMYIGGEQTSNWYNANWKYKKAITLESDHIETTESEFPVLVSTTLADLKSYAYDGHVGNGNGYDIIFVDDDNSTLLNFEQEKYVPSTGEIVYWVNTDISSTTDKVIYMYYGNASATDLSNAEGVWDDNFVMVQHLQEDPGPGGAGDIVDSTQYDNDGTAEASMTTEDQVAGQIDGSLDFDGGDDYINFDSSFGLVYPFTFCCNFYPRNFTSAQTLVSVAKSSVDDQRDLLYFRGDIAGDPVQVFTNSGGTGWASAATAIGVSSSAWHTACGVFISANNRSVYLDGGNVGSNTIDSVSPTGRDRVRIGARAQASGLLPFDGIVDEVRISNIARTAGWIETEYNNQSGLVAFLDIGAEEGLNRTAIVNAPITNYLTDGLVGHWTFNGEDMDWSQTTAEARDTSGQGNHGDVIGATAVIGKVGQGMSFDGVDDYVNLGAVSQASPIYGTIIIWIKADTLSGWQYIYNNCDANNRVYLYCDGANFQTRLGDSAAVIVKTLSTNTWYQLGLVWDNGTYHSYVDGVEEATGEYVGLDGIASSDYIGGYAGSWTFDGIIDEVRIYNRALLEDEIGQLYRMGARKMGL